MDAKADKSLTISERIRNATRDPSKLDAKEVASILCQIEDVGARRMILAQFSAEAFIRGDVSEVVAWAVVMSHMEDRRPAPDVQEEAKHLITAH